MDKQLLTTVFSLLRYMVILPVPMSIAHRHWKSLLLPTEPSAIKLLGLPARTTPLHQHLHISSLPLLAVLARAINALDVHAILATGPVTETRPLKEEGRSLILTSSEGC